VTDIFLFLTLAGDKSKFHHLIKLVLRAMNKNKRGPKPKGEISCGEAILKAAYRCFSFYGFDKATTRIIAAEAGVDASLIAYNFGSKDKLWLKVIDSLCEEQKEFIQGIEGLINGEISGKEAIHTLIEIIIAIAEQYPEFHMMISHEMSGDSERFGVLKTRLIDTFLVKVGPVLKRSMDEGNFPSGNPEMTLYFLLSGSSHVIHTWPERDGLLDDLKTLLLNMIP